LPGSFELSFHDQDAEGEVTRTLAGEAMGVGTLHSLLFPGCHS
jgi:hypothetical protein